MSAHDNGGVNPRGPASVGDFIDTPNSKLDSGTMSLASVHVGGHRTPSCLSTDVNDYSCLIMERRWKVCCPP